MTLPGMPIAIGDPGVFVCGPDDIAPWEKDAAPRRRVRPAAPQRTNSGTGAWLVLALCVHCSITTRRYCRDHGPDNWWLTNWGGSR